MCVVCDLPGVHKEFEGVVESINYSGFDLSLWPPGCSNDHRKIVLEINNCNTKQKKKKEKEFESSLVCPYTCLLDLPYFHYSISGLYGILPKTDFECWRQFVLACQIFSMKYLCASDIQLAHLLDLEFRKKVESIWIR